MPPRKKLKTEGAVEKAGQLDKQASRDTQDADEVVHWLLKSEPESRIENGVDMKARNILRDQMKLGHQCFFYHSNCKTPAIVGIVEVVKEGYPDHTQFDKKNNHYDR
ncbi:hypothetical protein MTO96_050748 [Rhipicephalus appendiculatus]